MADDPISDTQAAHVGYRKPPPGTRFRKGQSGNPGGKPKGSRNKPRSYAERLGLLMLEEAYRPVTVNEDGAEVTMPVAQAVFRSLAAAAAKGEARAQAMFLKLVSATEEQAAAIEDTLEEDREEPAKKVIEITIVDANGRPTGEVLYPYGGGPEPQDGENPPTG